MPDDPRDRALAFRLVREVTIWRLRLDATLEAYSSRPLGRLHPQVLSALRIGAVQMLVMGMPAHAAVSTACSAADGSGRSYANAVLRRLARDGEIEGLEPWVRLSHPKDLYGRWVAAFGRERAEALMAWDNEVPPLGGWSRDEGGEGRYIPGFKALERSGHIPEASAIGSLYLQDEAAAIVGEGVASLGGCSAAEIGASPGGKTVHLDPAFGLVISIDTPAARFARWRENAVRLGLSHSLPVVADGRRLPLAGMPGIMVDAPCTSTGIYRRHPDARWGWSAHRLAECSLLQRELLDEAAAAVARGGWLSYSVCSLEKEEREEQVIRFEQSHPGFRRLPFPAPPVLVRDGLLGIFPPEHGIDGHFAACWTRES